MTSFAFILGVVPLVTATGAGANSRISLGLCVFSGMIASTCLAVLFVPSFFTVLQRYEDWSKARKGGKRPRTPSGPPGGRPTRRPGPRIDQVAGKPLREGRPPTDDRRIVAAEGVAMPCHGREAWLIPEAAKSPLLKQFVE